MNSKLRYAFFGTGPLAESVLAALVRNGYTPSLIVTKPDAASGRHLELTPPHIKVWGEMKGIPVYQPVTLRELGEDSPLLVQSFDLFIVASYGKIIPEAILEKAARGVLNVHPSTLPLYRGPSPIESALLASEKTIGVSIMKLDKEVDHGPILVQGSIPVESEDTACTIEVKAGMEGGALLSQVLEHYLTGTLIPVEQDHSSATFCKKIEKEMGEITLVDNAETVANKWRAFTPWPGIYFFFTHGDKKIRVKVSALRKEDLVGKQAKDIILSVIPEGKKEMSFEDFKRGYGIA